MKTSLARTWLALTWISVLLLAAANTLIWGSTQSLFIERVGPQALAPFLLVQSLCTIASGFVTLVVLRRRRASIHSLALMLLALPTVLTLAAVQHGISASADIIFYAVLILSGAANASFLTVAIEKTFVSVAARFHEGTLIDADSSLRAAVTLGIFGGGLVLWLFGPTWETAIFMRLAAGLVTAAVAASLIRRAVKLEPTRVSLTAETSQDHLRQVFGPIATGGRLISLIVGTGAIIGLSALIGRLANYVFGLAAAGHFSTEGELNAFVGAYFVAISAARLLLAEVIQPRVLKRLSTGWNLFLPPATVAATVAYSLLSFGFWPIMAGVFVRDTALTMQETSVMLLLDRLGPTARNLAWSWFSGPVTGLADLAGSLLLMGLAWSQLPALQSIALLGYVMLALLLTRLWLNAFILRLGTIKKL